MAEHVVNHVENEGDKEDSHKGKTEMISSPDEDSISEHNSEDGSSNEVLNGDVDSRDTGSVTEENVEVLSPQSNDDVSIPADMSLTHESVDPVVGNTSYAYEVSTPDDVCSPYRASDAEEHFYSVGQDPEALDEELLANEMTTSDTTRIKHTLSGPIDEHLMDQLHRDVYPDLSAKDTPKSKTYTIVHENILNLDHVQPSDSSNDVPLDTTPVEPTSSDVVIASDESVTSNDDTDNDDLQASCSSDPKENSSPEDSSIDSQPNDDTADGPLPDEGSATDNAINSGPPQPDESSSFWKDSDVEPVSRSADDSNTSPSKSVSIHSDDQDTIRDAEVKPKVFNISRKSSKKRLDKVVAGTSENPIDITDLTVDSGSLLQLYQNDYFDAYMHMHHLYHRKEPGVHEYLVNLLYSKRTDSEVMFYLPQLCQLSISKYGKSSLHRFLLDRASTSMHFALKLSWFYQAIISDQASKIGHLAQKMTQETEMAVVNCKLISPLSQSAAPTVDKELNLCSKGLLIRRAAITAIRAGHEGIFNTATHIDALLRPTMPKQMIYNATTLLCPFSKVKVPTPYSKIGDPLDLETPPYVECPDEIQYELERLMMKQRRLDYFNMLSNFVKLCMEVSKLLTTIAKRDARLPLLTLFAKSMNEWMLVQRCVVAAYEESFAYRGLSLPMNKMGRDKQTNIPFQFLRIVEDEIKIFLSKKRAPFVLYFEIANLDEDVRVISRGEQGKSIESITFRDMYVYEAIVKDLVASGLLDVADVSYVMNPLECIRYTMGMLPPEVLQSHNERREQFKGRPLDSWRGEDDSVSSLLSAIHGVAIGSSIKSMIQHRQENYNSNSPHSASETKFPILERMSPEEAKAYIFPELFEEKKKKLRKYSPYGNLESWNVRAVIIKGGDDLRQEYMVNQLLLLFKEIFANAHLPLWIRPVEILVTGPNCGIIEFLHDTCSVDVVKRKFNVDSIARAFERMYAKTIYEARKNFIESHAAYSIISYLLQVRDRHNGNILLDSDGHVIHIDYGFCLSNTPGNISFETSPFKLTKEYVDVMGGETSDNFGYFKALVIRGLLEARKHMDRIVLLVEMMTDAHKMPCFAAGTTYTMDMLRERFMLNLSEDVCIDRIVAMIEESLYNFTTVQYDNFQRLTNGIK
ncbi:Phosphatidylinositol 3- and 4-kinase family protein [Babesia bovis T2Bo]|uniref:1-phosphatidylinositol 4-kinase n=1 Tax=Babesia bovis TaxID=5865 RepID=A7ARY7_BABBO|nr:Phosphatidylinositol 3- and 4-kinase family protein [Babesia bovis T2Bo]EDO07306.1 Phosphatidylinositol 3- and 4-kinase family protein [Babesia bovis T2Bo]|eukprot:XP_001610874.1 phosphatidylinositol 4 kinase [Babesia bovis T2Bo]